MATHDVKVGPFEYERIRVNEKHTLVWYRGDRDYQAGDTLRLWRNDTEPEYRYSTERVIAHVGHDVQGVDSRYVVLSLHDPRVKNLTTRLESAVEEQHRLARSNAALRGRVRRLAGR
ncbi:hypothetical protein SEA_FLAGSTAFF_36 [Mycobacterium phage FlagStaff]|uniref:DUF3850 domain-containing protein n=1 Tax=Mycobacterium phage FlagStaff TaxID=1647304 RepID=A0A0F6WE22_9CAUD|nr:RNA-binding protein [Mycobacterium phage FlagStaff]AKF14473.1 hypothetical protein SEA_FLAGSTAFF_36 [Mycobacterium phage FlagStaff]